MKIEERGNELVVTDFNELEAYKIASKIEKDGLRFYKELSEIAGSEETRRELEILIREEEKHLKFFDKQLNRLRQKIKDGFEEDDLLNYMDYGVFEPFESAKEKIAQKIDKAGKALRLGVIMEDKSIKFYNVCSGKVSGKAKDEIENIIAEEKKHKSLLEKMSNKLQ